MQIARVAVIGGLSGTLDRRLRAAMRAVHEQVGRVRSRQAAVTVRPDRVRVVRIGRGVALRRRGTADRIGMVVSVRAATASIRRTLTLAAPGAAASGVRRGQGTIARATESGVSMGRARVSRAAVMTAIVELAHAPLMMATVAPPVMASVGPLVRVTVRPALASAVRMQGQIVAHMARVSVVRRARVTVRLETVSVVPLVGVPDARTATAIVGRLVKVSVGRTARALPQVSGARLAVAASAHRGVTAPDPRSVASGRPARATATDAVVRHPTVDPHRTSESGHRRSPTRSLRGIFLPRRETS